MYGYDYGYGSTSSEIIDNTNTIIAGVFGIYVIIILICLVLSIIMLVGQWKSLKKAGKEGWEAIIPVYNMVVLCQICGLSPWWLLITFLGSIVLNLIPVLGQLASFALLIYFNVIFNVSLAKSFGKSNGFAFGLIFLPYVFWPLLGGKNTKYVGANPVDPLLGKLLSKNSNNNTNMNTNNGMNMNSNNNINMNINNGMNMNASDNMNMNTNESMNMNTNNGMNSFNTSSSNNTIPTIKYCKNCGAEANSSEIFCKNCGTKLD